MTRVVAVTGASGFIGRALVARLASSGVEVRAGTRADLASEDAMRQLMAGAECVVHLAARAHKGGGHADFYMDARLARTVARVAAQSRVGRFVQISSIGVLGTYTAGEPLVDSTPPAPREPYALAKMDAERAIREELSPTRTDWVILRPPMVYGPHAPGNFARLVGAVRRGVPLPLASVHNRRYLMGIANLVDAIELCMTHPAAARRSFVVCDAEAVSTAGLIECIAEGLGVRARSWPFPPALLEAAARLSLQGRLADSLFRDLVIDSSGFGRALGWKAPVPARQGIVEAAAAGRR
jgi:nucleoside-diphosphate-sugar epimerase